ncbi:MAG: Fe-S cluster assembly protein SufD [Pseudomonadota bacterium]
MNAHTPRLLTEGETGLIEAYKAADWLPGADDVGDIRTVAIDAIAAHGLPTRRVEAFHYTDLRALLPAGFKPSQRPTIADASAAMTDYERLVSAVRIPLVNGHYFADIAGDCPQGVSIVPTFLNAGLGAGTLDAADAVNTINSAFVTDGVAVTVSKGIAVEAIMTFAHSYVGEGGGIAATRNSVTVEDGASATMVDRSCGNDDLAYLRSTVTELTVGEGADLTYILSIEEGDAAQRLASLKVTLAKDAVLNLFVLNAGGKLVRQELDFSVDGENAALNISGVNLMGGEAHIDVTSRIYHRVPNTTAEETFRNVCTGRGRGVFQGQIRVAQPAQLTDARMACNTLLLSDDCDFSAKPELEIFADDVQCAHGATVADLEPSYLFYLQARGISEDAARRILVKAFVNEVVEELENETLVEALEGVIDTWMVRNV